MTQYYGVKHVTSCSDFCYIWRATLLITATQCRPAGHASTSHLITATQCRPAGPAGHASTSLPTRCHSASPAGHTSTSLLTTATQCRPAGHASTSLLVTTTQYCLPATSSVTTIQQPAASSLLIFGNILQLYAAISTPSTPTVHLE